MCHKIIMVSVTVRSLDLHGQLGVEFGHRLGLEVELTREDFALLMMSRTRNWLRS